MAVPRVGSDKINGAPTQGRVRKGAVPSAALGTAGSGAHPRGGRDRLPAGAGDALTQSSRTGAHGRSPGRRALLAGTWKRFIAAL